MGPGPRRPAPSALVPNIGHAHDAAASFQPAQPAQSFLHGQGIVACNAAARLGLHSLAQQGTCQVCLTRHMCERSLPTCVPASDSVCRRGSCC